MTPEQRQAMEQAKAALESLLNEYVQRAKNTPQGTAIDEGHHAAYLKALEAGHYLAAAFAAEAAGPDELTLFGVLADIRQKTGVGDKPMLSELADALKQKIEGRDKTKLAVLKMMRKACRYCADALDGQRDHAYRDEAGSWWHHVARGGDNGSREGCWAHQCHEILRNAGEQND